MPFQYDVGSEMLCHVACFYQSIVAIIAFCACEAVELGGVWCQDNTLWQLLHPCTMVAQYIDCVRIEHHRTLTSTNLGYHGDGAVFVFAQSRPYSESVDIVCVDGLGEISFFLINAHDGLGHVRLENRIIAFRCVEIHFTGTGTQTGSACKGGSAAHTIAAGDEHG